MIVEGDGWPSLAISTGRRTPFRSIPLLLLLPGPCSVLLQWLRSAGSPRKRRERLHKRILTRSLQRSDVPSGVRARALAWRRQDPGVSGRHQGSLFPCTRTLAAQKESTPNATSGAADDAGGSRRCASSPLESTPRAPAESSCFAPPRLLSLGFVSPLFSPPSSGRGNPWGLLQHPRDRGRGRGHYPGRGLHDSRLGRGRPGL